MILFLTAYFDKLDEHYITIEYLDVIFQASIFSNDERKTNSFNQIVTPFVKKNIKLRDTDQINILENSSPRLQIVENSL